MKQMVKRSMALIMTLVMALSLMPAFHVTADAASYDYNWGTRGVVATAPSDKAASFYTGDYTYEELAKNAGSATLSSVPTSALYTELQTLMSSKQTYITTYDDTREMFQYTDCQNGATESNKISSFYSGKDLGPAWDGGSTWNREHTWPNSKGEGEGENDIMMLRPTASNENSARGNKAYGSVTNASYYFPNDVSGGKLDLRGDVARIMLYVYVRWGNTQNMWGAEGVIESKEILLNWMAADPVDTWELGRNDSVQSITGTRNAFVDYPELAFLLFGEEVPATMITPSNVTVGHVHDFKGTETTPASCTEDGVKTWACSICSASYTEVIPATGHNYVNGTCTGCGDTQAAGEVWTKVALGQIKATDTVTITMSKDGTTWALDNTQGTNKAPAGIVVTVSGDTMTCEDAESISWNIASDANGLIIYKAGGTSNWLYSTDTNNGTRVGTNGNKYWTLDTNGYLKNLATNRWLGVYMTNPDWRCYTNTTGNTAGQTLTFWRLGAGDGAECTHEYTETVTTPATCTEDGVKTFTCSKCSDSYTEVIPATGHNYVDGTCTGCGDTVPQYTAVLVTDAAELSAGKQIIIVANGYDFALSTTQNSNNRGQAAITKSGSEITHIPEDVQLITLEEGKKADTFAFNVGNGYLYAASSSKNYLRTETNLSDNSSWKITISNGVANVVAQGTNTRNVLQYNQQSSLFSTYGSASQKPISIYVLKIACDHEYTEEVTTPATCTEEGVKTFTCGKCGDSYTEAIPATGHNYEFGTCTGCGAIEPPVWSKVALSDITAEDIITITMTKGETTWALDNTQGTSAAPAGIVVTVDGETMMTDDADVIAWNLVADETGLIIYKAGSTEEWLYTTDTNNGTRVGSHANKYWVVDEETGYLKNLSEPARYLGVYVDKPDWRSYKNTTGNTAGQTLTFWKQGCAHEYTCEVISEVSCTEDGVQIWTCSKCDERIEEITPAFGHDYKKGTCQICGDTPLVTPGVVIEPETTDKDNAIESCAGGASCPTHAFVDATADWYHHGVHYCVENGLMDGMSANQFDPNGTATRAQIVTILWRLENKPVVNYLMQFEDVKSDFWYTEAIRWAAAEKIVEGHDGKFDPDGAITREQLATILYRYEQYKNGGFTGAWMFYLNYPDNAEISSWAYEALCWMTMNGVISGSDGKLLPKGSATRAQIAMVLYRYANIER